MKLKDGSVASFTIKATNKHTQTHCIYPLCADWSAFSGMQAHSQQTQQFIFLLLLWKQIGCQSFIAPAAKLCASPNNCFLCIQV